MARQIWCRAATAGNQRRGPVVLAHIEQVNRGQRQTVQVLHEFVTGLQVHPAGGVSAITQTGAAPEDQSGKPGEAVASGQRAHDVGDVSLGLTEHERVERAFSERVLMRDGRVLATENDPRPRLDFLCQPGELVCGLVVGREHARHADHVVAGFAQLVLDPFPCGAPMDKMAPARVRGDLGAVGGGIGGRRDDVVVACPGQRVEYLDGDILLTKAGSEICQPDRHMSPDLDHAGSNGWFDQKYPDRFSPLHVRRYQSGPFLGDGRSRRPRTVLVGLRNSVQARAGVSSRVIRQAPTGARKR